MRKQRKRTPWGATQTFKEIVPGIEVYTTASHGGYWLDGKHVKVAKRAFPDFIPFAGYPWLEEDCDCVIVPLLWPETFTPYDVFSACRAVQSSNKYFVDVRRWLESIDGARVRQIAGKFITDSLVANSV